MSSYKVMEPSGMFKSKRYSDWVQDWTNWLYMKDRELRNTGDVVFLTSISFSKGVYKNEPHVMVGDDSLVISEDQRVLVPIITANSASHNTDNPEAMYGFVRSHIASGDDPPSTVQLKINKEQIKGDYLDKHGDFREYEIETPVFQVAIPEDDEGESLKNQYENAFESVGFFPTVTRGYFVLLEFKIEGDQEDFYIECSAKGATTDRGPYNASLFYHIIVNKSVKEASKEAILGGLTKEGREKIVSRELQLHSRPNRNVQVLVDKKYANNELGPGEYLEIMANLRINDQDQRFGNDARKTRREISDSVVDQTNL